MDEQTILSDPLRLCGLVPLIFGLAYRLHRLAQVTRGGNRSGIVPPPYIEPTVFPLFAGPIRFLAWMLLCAIFGASMGAGNGMINDLDIAESARWGLGFAVLAGFLGARVGDEIPA